MNFPKVLLEAELELRLPDFRAYTLMVGYFTSTFVLSWIALSTLYSGFVCCLVPLLGVMFLEQGCVLLPDVSPVLRNMPSAL